MLKIKADKMKDLEKFGFKKCNSTGGFIYFYIISKNYGEYVELVVNVDRSITLDVNYEDYFTDDMDIFYDIIKADMVEKVVEDERI